MEFVNLTPHTAKFFNDDGSVVVVPPSGSIARTSTISQEVVETTGLPGPVDGRIYIVSYEVRVANPSRRDLIAW